MFCTAAPNLALGTLLLPGEFGRRQAERVLYTKAGVDPAWAGVALMEMTWEVVRLREFPERPSRLSCLFLWENEAQARDFYSRRPWPAGLYEVQVEQCARVLVADMDLISYFDNGETTASLMDRARRYWKGRINVDVDGAWEVLLEGTARVFACLTPG